MNQFELTESILQYRKENDSFQKSISTRSDQMQWKFFDGPPFTSGDPHYGHLLQSTVKDMMPRRMTMRGYQVHRKRWWDCHGIPAENFVNKKLGITSKKQVEEEFGLQKYVEECRTMVWDVNDNRKRFVDHLWRWVDMDNAYFTMHNEYMESVIHLFADLYHNNLIYKWFKVLGYSRSLGTALSNSEIAEWYMDRQDPAVTVKLRLTETRNKKLETRDFETTEDGYGEVTLWVLRKEDKILMVYDTRSWKRFIPWGKVDTGETLEQSITRELFEEIWIAVTSTKLLWKTKVPHHNKLRRLNCLECEYTWEFENKEPEKQWAIAWISKIESDNELWYAIKIEPIWEESSIIADVEQFQYDFADFLMIAEEKYHPDMVDAPISMLAWTTTPWTLPSNMFGAVNNDVVYVVVFDLNEKEYYILAKWLLSKYYKDQNDYILTYQIKWNHFVWLSYEPLFDYYYKAPDIDQKYHSEVHKILHADFVTEDSGTGIAHEAPAFGEDDYNLVMSILPAQEAKERLFNPVNDHGEFTDEVSDFAGRNVIDTNKDVIKHLKERGLLVKQETINHSYPHCPRTKEPIIYRAMESRFVKEKDLTTKSLPLADEINFVPSEIKKRFTNGLGSAPDWNISRSRFRWAPLPVWECESVDCEERQVYGSIADIAEASGQEVTDLHRPYIDDITIPCACGATMRRVPEVLDCWFESGSMPYGQDHYLKSHNPDQISDSNFAADFIAEALDQTRGWFRALHVLGTAYTDNIVYKNVVVTWLILAEDGKKMSKSLQNYPDPRWLFEKYGSDTFRLYMLWSPVMRGEPFRFIEQWVEQVLKDFVIPIQNVWNFFKTYASVDGWKDDGTEIYMMRHAAKDAAEDVEDAHIGLSDAWKQQLKDPKFVESVVRISPDIIITSPCERTTQTALACQSILKKFANKDVEVREVERCSIWSDTAGYMMQELVGMSQRVLVISHKPIIKEIWYTYFWDTAKPLLLDYTEIIKLPTTPIHNELDQRILSELYTMMWELDTQLEGYHIESATKSLMWFMDKLTNRWLRRSRRRFWAEGLDKDKQAVYWTLREVLSIYLKLAAPFAPFVTEWVWQEMKQFRIQNSESWTQSIHLEYRPIHSDKYINSDLSQEITHVRKIIKWAMYLRAKHQIKVKQPLQELKFGF